MDKNVIFGSNVNLPSIEGLESGCEDELCLLMKEIDLAFGRKNKDLLSEVAKLKALAETKKDEIENLKSILKSRTQSNKQNLEEHTKHLKKEIEKLKDENTRLKSESSSLQRKVRFGTENENQLERMKRNLTIQLEENAILRDRETKLLEKYRILQENYQGLVKIIVLEKGVDGAGDNKQHGTSASNFIDALISQETEAYLNEEGEHYNKLQTQINTEIEELRRTLNDEAI